MDGMVFIDPCEEYVQRLDAIQEINNWINSEVDHLAVYNIILDRMATHLKVDAAALLLNTSHNVLVYTAGRGFSSSRIRQSKVNVGEGAAGTAAQTKMILHFNHPTTHETSPGFVELMKSEGFVGYLAAPLVVRERVVAVLELYSREPLLLSNDWVQYLSILAGQAAMAVRKDEIIRNQTRANIQLELAYGETLEAWMRAVELRDHYTAGHTQRVTEMALRLSTKIGVAADMLEHITRGALLHDVGKLAVPDEILMKNGPLNETEWKVMRQHPVHARELLEPIQYLKPAIDIPYCHHERWDGSGYPQGLRGEDIPLQARIFSVVDVWDALVSDRPYRNAWAEDKAMAYIQSKSGIEFDPVVVEAFIDTYITEKMTTVPVEVNRDII
jgi:response regulator RpfG family c-di-GMP phosphodiesterase